MPRDVMSGSKKPGDHKQIDKAASTAGIDTSDRVLADLLKRLKATADPNEIRQLSDQIERIIFHKQFTNA
jgi:hypothetical protein